MPMRRSIFRLIMSLILPGVINDDNEHDNVELHILLRKSRCKKEFTGIQLSKIAILNNDSNQKGLRIRLPVGPGRRGHVQGSSFVSITWMKTRPNFF